MSKTPDYQQQILDSATSLLDSDVKDIMALNDKEKIARLDACKRSLGYSGGLRLPMPDNCKDHIDYAFEATTKFDKDTQKVLMRSFLATRMLKDIQHDEGTNYAEISRFIKNIKDATRVLLFEREAQMIGAGELPNHSTAHAATMILFDESLAKKYTQKNKAALRELSRNEPKHVRGAKFP
jgi:hypothetical protein